MRLFLLEPEVAGGLGNHTIFDKKKSPVEVVFLNYEFSGWLGDELLETNPCFIVTEALASTLLKSGLSGLRFETVEITVNEEFKDFHPDTILPNFKRLIPLGNVLVDGNNFSKWSGHDFSLSQKSNLIATLKALEVLRKHLINYCDITVLEEILD
ncbi:MAG: hypothetical protein GXY86_13125 [Firmicutes bacterium]|nr:hypothetical protein [Bacillota bacterium]